MTAQQSSPLTPERRAAIQGSTLPKKTIARILRELGVSDDEVAGLRTNSGGLLDRFKGGRA